MTIRNPVQWSVDQFRAAPPPTWVEAGRDRTRAAQPPAVRCIGMGDLRDALARGWQDFGASRADVVFLCIAYPLIGLLLARYFAGNDMLPLVFPLASGFALVGPLAGVGLYEMSRRRERGEEVGWSGAFAVASSPAFGQVLLMGLLLAVLYVAWLLAAWAIYAATLGPQPPASADAFLHDVFTTGAGWAMIVVGVGVGGLFAAAALAISAVSFPLLLDRDVGVGTAVRTSLHAFATNPLPMLAWGLVVTAGLVLGSLPLFIGLVVVLPVLAHATWHLYRKLVA